jgi:hypothetical protein
MAQSTDASSPLLRRGLLALAALTTLGIVVELAVERHWTQPIQLVAWVALGACAVAIALVARMPSRDRVRAARAIAMAVVLCALLGIGAHVYANYDAGPLDQRYADTWESLSEPVRWGLALTKTVGPSPPLASGALAQAALAVLLATVRHPSLREAPAVGGLAPANASRAR